MAAILIVDDEVDCRKPLAALLRHEGYEISEARDGLEGLQRLNDKHQDLVILDMMMPGCDGVSMLQAMRRQEAYSAIPVLMVTGMHEPELLRKARVIGVQEYLFKGDCPFARMLELIKRHLGEHHVPKRRGRKPKIPRPPEPLPGQRVEEKPMERWRRPVPRFMQLELEFLDADDAA
jgi:two-component system, chemotaxis family, chemotaxis protein CheY